MRDRSEPWPSRVEQAHRDLVRVGHVDSIVAVSTPEGRFAVGDDSRRAEIGSVTKLFTSLLLTVLAEAGQVRLDDTVGTLLPAGTVLAPGLSAITLESLACHRSGLPRLPPGMSPFRLRRPDLSDPYAAFDEAALLAALARVRVRGVPGQASPAYSNLGAGLLGYLLGRAAGTGFQDALTARVLAPLGLDRTTTFSDENLRQGHHRGRPVGPWHLAALAGAGGLRAPAADLLTYLEAVRDGSGPLSGPIAETLRPRNTGRVQFGLGWLILGDGDLLMHDGGTLGARCEVRVERRSGTCVVVLGDARRGTAKAAMSLLDPKRPGSFR